MRKLIKLFYPSITKSGAGFTLIELLVVISIIGLLASVLFVAVGAARAKARDTKRRADLVQLVKGLELYYNDNNSYPVTSFAVNSGWRGMCAAYNNACNGGGNGSCTVSGVSGWIPNLAPTYVGQLPRDPMEGIPTTANCYMYKSDGINYKIMDWQAVESMSSVPATDPFYDPAGRAQTLCVYSPGAAAW